MRRLFALYFRRQNAAILIEIDEKPLISSWQVQLPIKEITSSLKPHLSWFPLPKYRLNNRSQLTNRTHCELLMELMENTIECPQSMKSDEEFDETRDVPISHYVTQWWIKHFPGIQLEKSTKSIEEFSKKHRDHIRWKKARLPFRRSGLWMAMKIVLQTILIKHFENIGTIIYKLLITSFLIYMIEKMHKDISIDLLVHGLRKIARRIKKIDNIFLKISPNRINQWIVNTKHKIQKQMKRLLITFHPMNIEQSSIPNFDLTNRKIYHHGFQDFQTHSSNSFFKSIELNSSRQTDSDIPSIEYLQNVLKYSVCDILTYIEIWIESSLRTWLSCRRNSFEILLNFFETYQTHALTHYRAKEDHPDSIGYSRFVLTSLTIIYHMHQILCQDFRFERLNDHSVHISNVFEYLILPYLQDMIRAKEIYDYFKQFQCKAYPDLLKKINRADAFGVYFAERSDSMKATLQEIRNESERDKQAKIEEVKRAKIKYQELLDRANTPQCLRLRSRRRKKCWCTKCDLIKQGNALSVSIYECPIPSDDCSALAVIFELQMPIEIRCYREILWQFTNRPDPKPFLHMFEWLKVPPHQYKLGKYYRGPMNISVKLVSSTESLTQTHFSIPGSILTRPIESFLFENSLEVQISPTKPLTSDDECDILTPTLPDADYQSLQWTLSNTEFAQNRVIAQLSDCPLRIKPSQFIEFGSFRSGDRLQWWNLLALFELESLPIENENVVLLIIHSLYQYGPISDNQTWCTDAHRIVLNDDDFVDELISKLNHRLNQCEFNWQNELVLIAITMVTTRILTLCNVTKTEIAAELIKRCRNVGEKWNKLICESIKNSCSTNLNETDELRTKLVHIGIACQLTYSIDLRRIHYVLSTDEDLISLFKASTTVHDNYILSTDQTNVSSFMRDLRRFSERVLLSIQPEVHRLIRQFSYQSLNKFSKIYWAVLHEQETINGNWKKRIASEYDGWYDCLYDYQSQSIQISINCLTGTFLVNGMTVGFLPKTITSHPLFLRVFDQHIFEVQPYKTPNTYITKYTYHGVNDVQYTFQFDENLIVFELHQGERDTYQLISLDCFRNELPDIFTSNYSHWKNTKTNQIDFRPIRFNDAQFLIDRPYIFDLNTGLVTTIDKTKLLVSQSSEFFQYLYQEYFYRLDDQPYVYIMKDHHLGNFQIYTSRLGLTFQYHPNARIITSREYPTMCVANDQSFGTLIGLQFGLLLSSREIDKSYQCRKLIVPFGQVQLEKDSNTDEPVLTLERTSFQHQYFVYNLNDRLRIIQSTDSPTGWLYLALLHALTSRSLLDSFTGMTGMERAFQLLKSAGSWNDQPYDELSLNILYQIAMISPEVNYYPRRFRFTVMEEVHWKNRVLPYSIQHFGYYLIVRKLIDTSEQLKFMYSTSNETPELPKNNLQLLRKLYWDYRDSYNSAARLPKEMEDEILESFFDVDYKSTSTNHSYCTEYNRLDLVNDLYGSGDIDLKDPSQLDCFALSKWLKPEYNLRNIWIGLLKKIISIKTNNEIERFEILLDFLHYISFQTESQPFFLQLLRTALKHPSIFSQSIVFPKFGFYNSIEEISVQMNRIPFQRTQSEEERLKIKIKIEHCFANSLSFSLNDFEEITIDTSAINRLLTTWRENKALRLFLQTIQNLICSKTIQSLNRSIPIESQRFTLEAIENHYQIKLAPSNKSIDLNLLSICRSKFCHQSSDDLVKSISIIKRARTQNPFPYQIFPSDNPQKNLLSNIAKHFKTQLYDSWQQFLSINQEKKEYPSIETTQDILHSSRSQSEQIWNELYNSIRSSNELLFKIGILTRVIPTNLISILLQIRSNQSQQFDISLTDDQCILLGGLIVNWIFEQQLERALHKHEDFEKELSNRPHTNWIPSDHLAWLILELEMNITIRDIQIDVALHMMQDNQSVMQMNMGEGKTSVIIPMLAVRLDCVRLIVLKSLFAINNQSLKYKLGGLLSRRIFPFICRRQMNFNQQQINQIFKRLKTSDIILTSPEYILSFDLLTIDRCRRNEYELARSMLNIYKWMRTHLRDILDESDEILHVKYQLIYTVGPQQSIDGGAERWKIIQKVLQLVKRYGECVAKDFPKDSFYRSSKRQSTFPEFRLLSTKPYSNLCEQIIKDWFNGKHYQKFDPECLSSFTLSTNFSIEDLNNQFPSNIIQLLLILRGLLSFEVLFLALKKRYRVNYGINTNPNFNRMMAVPFRAKDIAAENTEFGHPDLAIVLTQFSYYYSGLSDSQLSQCLNRLKQEENEPSEIYETWILYDNKAKIHSIIQNWNGVNLKDYDQRTKYLYPVLRCNMLVIDYFLNHFVYPYEAKQFPEKYIGSAWDLASSIRKRVVTGFSGTNDTQLLLPVHICQRDLPQLKKTDALVVNNLLRPENENYRSLEMNITSEEILKRIVRNQPVINVILDVGALFIDETNRQIAEKWLKFSDKNQIDYAIYFESDSIFVCDRQFHHQAFLTSPASERLDRCVIYLDEIHTRGSDFKFPKSFHAVLTLGIDLTKDRFVQAAMRMRQLGNGHSLSFWSSNEVDQQIKKFKNDQTNINLFDILRWVYENTQQATWNGFHHWAMQSLNFQRKIAAFQSIQWKNLSDKMMNDLARNCLEPEIIDLKLLYGSAKRFQTLDEIYKNRSKMKSDLNVHQEVLKRLKEYSGSKKRLTQLFDEEQERELEQEIEEQRQIERAPAVEPCQSILHPEIRRLCDMHGPIMNLEKIFKVFCPLVNAFQGTTFYHQCQAINWKKNLWITTEFQRVIETKGEALDSFLRPPRWVIIYRKQYLIFVSPFEANWLIKNLTKNSVNTSLRLLLPRRKRIQSIFINEPKLIIPSNRTLALPIPLDWLVNLFIFNGTLYFENKEEQDTFCRCFSHSNSLTLLKKILEIRNHSFAPLTSHVGREVLF